MSALSKQSRSKLESITRKARTTAEKAARTELERLGVDVGTPPGYLSADEKELRRRLRSHGRQLGDTRLAQDGQELSHLASEVAYEHWHRMLFARFLAENELLIHPKHKVPLSLADCEELAREQEQASGARVTSWDLAARFASGILPQIFRVDSPSLVVSLAPDERQALEALLGSIPPEVFGADDSLGWVYQFWQAERKDEVNAAGAKIGAEELPAVTQLFTEDYMVEFLLDNSLGAWWASKRLGEGLVKDFEHREDETQRREDNEDVEKDRKLKIEEGLRKRVALPGVPFKYLRFVEDEGKGWRAAAGSFGEWPRTAAGLRYLDPCCGSGHFLVAGYRYLTAMRMAEEGLDAKAAGDSVLRDNLYGLELDPRCVEIAAFSLAFEAWRAGGGYRPLPEMHVACSGLAPRTTKAEWLRVADQAAGIIASDSLELIPDPNKASLWQSELHAGLESLYDLFRDAPVLGSLIDPRSVTGTLFRAGFDQTADLLAGALRKERALDESRETGVAAQGIAKAASLLSGRYHLVATNVPYLARGKQDEVLRAFCDEHYPEAKNDLATVFLDRCLALCETGGTATIVLPQNWLFLGSYKKFREKLIMHDRWNILARLGPGAFETIGGEIVNVALITISAGQDRKRLRQAPFVGTAWRFAGIDAAASREPAEKAGMLRSGEFAMVGQAGQLGNPDGRIVFGSEMNFELLSKVSNSYQGLSPADAPRFGLLFWETLRSESFWQGACIINKALRYFMWVNDPFCQQPCIS